MAPHVKHTTNTCFLLNIPFSLYLCLIKHISNYAKCHERAVFNQKKKSIFYVRLEKKNFVPQCNIVQFAPNATLLFAMAGRLLLFDKQLLFTIYQSIIINSQKTRIS